MSLESRHCENVFFFFKRFRRIKFARLCWNALRFEWGIWKWKTIPSVLNTEPCFQALKHVIQTSKEDENRCKNITLVCQMTWWISCLSYVKWFNDVFLVNIAPWQLRLRGCAIVQHICNKNSSFFCLKKLFSCTSSIIKPRNGF